MKTISPGLTTALAQQVTTKAHCWKIVRRDSVPFFFTDHDQDLVVDGDTYVSSVGYQQTAVDAAADLSIKNLEVTGYFDTSALTAADLRSGLFDFAEAHVFVVDWSNLSLGKMQLVRAYLGEVRSTPSGIFTSELRGLSQRLAAKVADVYTPECRADLGDAKCKINLAPFTFAEIVTGVGDGVYSFAISNDAGKPDHYYAYGTAHFTSGLNNGRYVEIKDSLATGGITMAFDLPYPVASFDAISLTAGCDKKHATCLVKFNNIVNRRAEDFIPGLDAVIQTPNATVA